MDRDDLFGRDRGWTGDERYGDRGRRGWEREREERRLRGEGDDRYGYRRDFDDQGRDRTRDPGAGRSEWERERYGRGDISRHYRRGRHEDWQVPNGDEAWRPEDRYHTGGRHEEGWRERLHDWRARASHRLGMDSPDPWSGDYRRREARRWHHEELGVYPWLKEVVLGYEGEELPPFYGLGHRGERRFSRGPKGYKRNDDRIREDVCECLVDHPWVNVDDVEVLVTDGEVTLVGTVPARVDKREVEDVAHDIRGVRDVHNQLRVVRVEPHPEPPPLPRRPETPRA